MELPTAESVPLWDHSGEIIYGLGTMISPYRISSYILVTVSDTIVTRHSELACSNCFATCKANGKPSKEDAPKLG